MVLEIKLEGRMEKRLPIAIVVHLARVQDQPVDGAELTYTDNVSAHGARVLSNRPWQIGEQVQVTSFKEKTPIRGKVAHCQKVGDKRYSIGLNFNGGRVTWSTFRAYSGT
jgi:PilZ domain